MWPEGVTMARKHLFVVFESDAGVSAAAVLVGVALIVVTFMTIDCSCNFDRHA